MTSDALVPLRDQVAAHPVPGPLPPRILQAREGVEAAAGLPLAERAAALQEVRAMLEAALQAD